MRRSKKFDEQYDDDAPLFYDDDMDLEELFDSLTDRKIRRRRRSKLSTRRHLDDLEERRWLRQHMDDWDSESIH